MKVNLFLIGAMRAGSTTIYHFLNQHPEIYMSPVKEPYYFLAEYYRQKIETGVVLAQTEQSLANHVLHTGKYRISDAYHALFEGADGYAYVGEASLYLDHPYTAELIHAYNSSAKVIISLRNPVERIFSEYFLYLRSGKIRGSFEDFITPHVTRDDADKKWHIMPTSRIPKGFYAQLLPPWLYYFGRDNVHIIFFEDLIRNPIQTSHLLYAWLGVESAFRPVNIHAERSGKPLFPKLLQTLEYNWIFRNVKQGMKRVIPTLLRIKIRNSFHKIFLKKETMDVRMRELLSEIYLEDIEQLEYLLSKDLSAWKATSL